MNNRGVSYPAGFVLFVDLASTVEVTSLHIFYGKRRAALIDGGKNGCKSVF